MDIGKRLQSAGWKQEGVKEKRMNAHPLKRSWKRSRGVNRFYFSKRLNRITIKNHGVKPWNDTVGFMINANKCKMTRHGGVTTSQNMGHHMAHPKI